MALIPETVTVRRRGGPAVAAATVRVRDRATNANVLITEDEAGTQPMANPSSTDANGRLTFWREVVEVVLEIRPPGGDVVTIPLGTDTGGGGGEAIGDPDAPLPDEYLRALQFVANNDLTIDRNTNYAVQAVDFNPLDQGAASLGPVYPGVAIPVDDGAFPGLLTWLLCRRSAFKAVWHDPAMDLDALDPQVAPEVGRVVDCASLVVPEVAPTEGPLDLIVEASRDFGRGAEPAIAAVSAQGERIRPLRDVVGFVRVSLP